MSRAENRRFPRRKFRPAQKGKSENATRPTFIENKLVGDWRAVPESPVAANNDADFRSIRVSYGQPAAVNVRVSAGPDECDECDRCRASFERL